MVQPAGASSLVVESARPADFPRIAQLTVDVYVGGGLATPAYAPGGSVPTVRPQAHPPTNTNALE